MAAAAAIVTAPALAADPWADAVVEYEPGNGASIYTDPLTALGEPTRFTGELFEFPGAVTPFSPAFEPDELVAVGVGGTLVVRFDEPVTNDPLNPFGIDLLIFGNSFFTDADYPNGVAEDFSGEGGFVELSADGATWKPVRGLADSGFPTLGYLDLGDPYSPVRGDTPSDFTRPVDPSFDALGKAFGDIVVAYAGSGGGLGIDFSPTGLNAVQYVRITTHNGNSGVPEIDGFADVSPIPAPGTTAFALIMLGVGRRRHR